MISSAPADLMVYGFDALMTWSAANFGAYVVVKNAVNSWDKKRIMNLRNRAYSWRISKIGRYVFGGFYLGLDQELAERERHFQEGLAELKATASP
jgi:hypothetical protein